MKAGNRSFSGIVAESLDVSPDPTPNPQKEQIYPLKELGRYVGFQLPYTTIRNWHRKGLINPHSGKRVKIGTVRMTYGLGTSVEEYWRFIDKLNETSIDPQARSG